MLCVQKLGRSLIGNKIWVGIFKIGTLTMPNSKEQMKKYIPENILILLSQRRRNKMIRMILNEKVDLSDRTSAQSQL